MSAITPSTDLYLLKCPLEIDMNNQLTFANKSAQTTYFSSLPHKTVADISYQRKDGVIRYPAHIDSLLEYNYVMYQNENYTHKWFYAFITRMEYLNDGCTAIYIQTDPYQTFMFDITYKPSFIEREHVNSDTIGSHTLDEGLSLGEFVINNVTNKTVCAPTTVGGWIVCEVTEYPDFLKNAQTPAPRQHIYNGIVHGTFPIFMEYNSTGYQSLMNLIRWYDSNSKKDAINALYVLPKNIYPSDQTMSVSTQEGDYTFLNSHIGATNITSVDISINSTLDGYTPKNKKCLCYPFNYIMVTNNSGTDSVYHYEDFNNPSSNHFSIVGVVAEGGSVKCYPTNYKNTTGTVDAYDFGIDMGKLPTFAWINDSYLNWQASNSIQAGVNAGESYLGSLRNNVGVTMGKDNLPELVPRDTSSETLNRGITKTLGTVGQFFKSIKSSLSDGYTASLVPDTASGATTGDVTFAIGRSGFSFFQMSVRYEVAKAIDDYFSMFGYKVNRVKVPYITTRPNWNYVKTAECNIEGNIPQEYMQEIKAMFNKGVTLWHNPNTFLDYSQNNSIV